MEKISDLNRVQIELFATQTLLKCFINVLMAKLPGNVILEREIAEQIEKSVAKFALRGADDETLRLAKDIMLNSAQQMLSDALPPAD